MNLSAEGINRAWERIGIAKVDLTIESQDLGRKCREFRQDRHQLSLRKCAKAMAISAVYLSDLELGRRLWNADLLERFKTACAKKGSL